MTKTATRIKGVTVTTVLDGRGVDVVFRSPYRWQVYEGERNVSAEFGWPLRGLCVDQDDAGDALAAAWNEKVDAGTVATRLQAA